MPWPEEIRKVWFLVRRDLNMTKGKVGAQCAHGIVEVLLGDLLAQEVASTPRGEDGPWEEVRHVAPLLDWYRDGQTKVTLRVDDVSDLIFLKQQLVASRILVREVIDNGTTMFDGEKTLTLLAVGPCYPSQVKDILGHLKPL